MEGIEAFMTLLSEQVANAGETAVSSVDPEQGVENVLVPLFIITAVAPAMLIYGLFFDPFSAGSNSGKEDDSHQ